MKILGIGNAIIDVICKIDEKFILQNNLSKGNMKLIFNESEFKKLLLNLKIEKTISGGSVANSIVGLSQLGNKVGFIGKISDDKFGEEYEIGLKKEKVEYLYSKKKELLPTGTCLILITPDSERTMCTFLGTAGKINADDINEEIIKNSEMVFLEGYLWDEGNPKKAFDELGWVPKTNLEDLNVARFNKVMESKLNFETGSPHTNLVKAVLSSLPGSIKATLIGNKVRLDIAFWVELGQAS